MKENFTANNKPAAKVLSNKKSWLRKKICGRTACAPNSGALLCCQHSLPDKQPFFADRNNFLAV